MSTILSRASALAALSFLLACPTVEADTVAVDCRKKGASINAVLTKLSKQGPHTINIWGTCIEAVTIDNFDMLTLAGASPGAGITVPGLEQSAVVISHSRNVTVRNLAINGDGTGTGIGCGFFSQDCVFHDITIGGHYTGINVARSASATVGDNSIVENNVIGLSVARDSHVRVGAWPGNGGATIRNNGNETEGGAGIFIVYKSHVDLFNSSVQGTVSGEGVVAQYGSFLGLINSTISGNDGDGVYADSGSIVALNPGNTIESNGGAGITVGHLSFLRAGGNTIASNAGAYDVYCRFSTAKAIGIDRLGGGSTNCVMELPLP